VIDAHVADVVERPAARLTRKLQEADADLDVADTNLKRNAVLRKAMAAIIEYANGH
jgi:hypothetical protein